MVIDPYSPQVVGRPMAEHRPPKLVMDALIDWLRPGH
ncbi:hypothetical protein METHB2_40097 [Candidatus Methylobacter favarea]|uniref:Uncharacterized protein n=1 Tax=Candidatus Methylobacter favarea TaxID=2707345 RepID=A0A8S0WQE6_9GAMM|nr:hypothetical protein METHB2_40097 [Candidatus Methylobacter favarea]